MKKMIIVVWGLWASAAYAQQSFTLEQAVETALRKNQLIQSGEYQVEYYRQLKRSATDIGKLSAVWMHGQYNSIFQDNNYTLMQTIPFPTQLSSQIQLGREQVIGAQKNLRSIQNDLVQEVRSVYYQLLYQEELHKLLLAQDSLYADFSKASTLRYKTGETNLLEMTTAETQWMEVKNQARMNEADIRIAETRLQALLKNDSRVIAADALKKRDIPQELDSVMLASNPQLGYLFQQAVIGQRLRQVERNRILPDISVGYFSQSLIGVQNINGQDQYFGRNKRFQGFELGLSIPLWITPHLARARAAGFNEAAARKNAEHYQTTLQGAYSQAFQELDKNSASLQYYESSALKNAELILNQSRKAFASGQIGYMEYLQALRNAIGIKSNYLQSLNLYNQSVVRIEFLLGKF